jgi:hypothetical protein
MTARELNSALACYVANPVYRGRLLAPANDALDRVTRRERDRQGEGPALSGSVPREASTHGVPSAPAGAPSTVPKL